MTDNNKTDLPTGSSAVSATFALPFAKLCSIAYYHDHACIPQMVTQDVPISSWDNGEWTCVWGPCDDLDNANLAYVAKFVPDDLVALPTYVVVVRGTDIIKHFEDLIGNYEQLKEDLDVTEQVEAAFLGAPLGAKIASGTHKGLMAIQDLSDPKMPADRASLADFLIAEMGAYGTDLPRLVVTGHSLGGCLATVVAPFLMGELAKHSLAPKILPYTFAGPSAGNAAFAQYYDNTFVPNYRYYNSLDIIPHWWASVGALKTIYRELEIPDLVALFFDYMQHEIDKHGSSYEQPSTGNSRILGAFLLNRSWTKEAKAQHHVTNYVALLEGKNAPEE